MPSGNRRTSPTRARSRSSACRADPTHSAPSLPPDGGGCRNLRRTTRSGGGSPHSGPRSSHPGCVFPLRLRRQPAARFSCPHVQPPDQVLHVIQCNVIDSGPGRSEPGVRRGGSGCGPSCSGRTGAHHQSPQQGQPFPGRAVATLPASGSLGLGQLELVGLEPLPRDVSGMPVPKRDGPLPAGLADAAHPAAVG